MLIQLLFQNPIVFILVAVTLMLSISVHEFAHAYVADKLGDPTARNMGRLTLKPSAHLDPYGTLMLLFAGFGWGKPVPFNPFNLKNPKRDGALISLAGPASNFIFAIITIILIKILGMNSLISQILLFVVIYNLSLGVFNLLPFGPLDGFKIVYGILPMNLAIQWAQMETYGIFILLIIVITGSTSWLITPVVDFIMKISGI